MPATLISPDQPITLSAETLAKLDQLRFLFTQVDPSSTPSAALWYGIAHRT